MMVLTFSVPLSRHTALHPRLKHWGISGAIAGMALLGAVECAVAAAPFSAQSDRSGAPSASLLVPNSHSPLYLSQQTGSLVVEEGDSGALVEELQRRLTELGYYDGPISGYFGELTKAAVIRFQTDRGLNPDGIVGASTTAALRQGRISASGGDANLLALGDRGDAVSRLQTRLRDAGYYDGPISGYFGELTESAVRDFQRARGLRVDGIAGASTQAALERSATPASARPDPNDGLLERGETGSAVADLQRRLQALNYYQGNIDGDYGARTEAAVMAFQRSQGLTADGIVGPATAAALNNTATARSAPPPATVNASPEAPVESPSPSPVEPPPLVTAAPPVPPTPPLTPANLPPSLPPQVASSLPAGQASVVAIQQRLRDQGYYTGAIDGILGPETLRAIAAAQENYGVQANDMLDGGP
ncbi:MAG: peptidoglycan-binding protein [Synechococcales bacterium]|nr:peptidoglycan-binding protein [Synechococcales bacterium]